MTTESGSLLGKMLGSGLASIIVIVLGLVVRSIWKFVGRYVNLKGTTARVTLMIIYAAVMFLLFYMSVPK